MRKLLAVLGLVFLLMIPISCSTSPKTSSHDIASGEYVTSTQAATTSYTKTTTTNNGISFSTIADSDYTDRMIVRTGNMTILVTDINSVITEITQLAKQYQGYVVASQSWQDNGRYHGVISIRVPSDVYDTVLDAVSGMAVAVNSQTTTSEDVTEEYVDLTSQLSNLQATEQQLLTIMQKADTVGDVLAVQNQLTNTRSQIEQIKGRMQYLEKTSSTSLLNVTLEQASLAVKLTADKTQVNVGEGIDFTATISGGVTPYSYEWNFGDGDKSNDANVAHKYQSSGTYTISLIVTDDRGNANTDTRYEYIKVLPGWSAGSVAGSAWSGLVGFGRVLANILIWLGIFSPVWILGAGIPLFIYFRRKRKTVKTGSKMYL